MEGKRGGGYSGAVAEPLGTFTPPQKERNLFPHQEPISPLHPTPSGPEIPRLVDEGDENESDLAQTPLTLWSGEKVREPSREIDLLKLSLGNSSGGKRREEDEVTPPPFGSLRKPEELRLFPTRHDGEDDRAESKVIANRDECERLSPLLGKRSSGVWQLWSRRIAPLPSGRDEYIASIGETKLEGPPLWGLLPQHLHEGQYVTEGEKAAEGALAGQGHLGMNTCQQGKEDKQLKLQLEGWKLPGLVPGAEEAGGHLDDVHKQGGNGATSVEAGKPANLRDLRFDGSGKSLVGGFSQVDGTGCMDKETARSSGECDFGATFRSLIGGMQVHQAGSKGENRTASDLLATVGRGEWHEGGGGGGRQGVGEADRGGSEAAEKEDEARTVLGMMALEWQQQQQQRYRHHLEHQVYVHRQHMDLQSQAQQEQQQQQLRHQQLMWWYYLYGGLAHTFDASSHKNLPPGGHLLVSPFPFPPQASGTNWDNSRPGVVGTAEGKLPWEGQRPNWLPTTPSRITGGASQLEVEERRVEEATSASAKRALPVPLTLFQRGDVIPGGEAGTPAGKVTIGKKRECSDDIASPDAHAPAEVALPATFEENGKRTRRQMSSGNEKKLCINCQTSDSPFWRKDKKGRGSLCNACGLYFAKNETPRPKMLWKRGDLDE